MVSPYVLRNRAQGTMLAIVSRIVPADKLLGDRRLTLGGSDDRFSFAEGFRQDFLAGTFTVPGQGGAAGGGRW